MYRFALRPRWILSHLFALAIVAGCITAGFWQLERLQQRREVNDRHEARAALPIVSATDLLGPGDGEQRVDEVELRTVESSGVYQVADQVLVSNRTYEGSPGYWVLTPLLTGDGVAVVVNRGWVPMQLGEGDEITIAAPPGGTVRVTGQLTASQVRGRFGAVDPEEGTLARLARADISRVAAQVPYPVLPAYVTLAEQTPPQEGTVPVALPPVELGEGPHMGYAFQWFTFATIAAGGYPIILRKVARERAAEAAGDPWPSRRSSQVPVDD